MTKKPANTAALMVVYATTESLSEMRPKSIDTVNNRVLKNDPAKTRKVLSTNNFKAAPDFAREFRKTK